MVCRTLQSHLAAEGCGLKQAVGAALQRSMMHHAQHLTSAGTFCFFCSCHSVTWKGPPCHAAPKLCMAVLPEMPL